MRKLTKVDTLDSPAQRLGEEKIFGPSRRARAGKRKATLSGGLCARGQLSKRLSYASSGSGSGSSRAQVSLHSGQVTRYLP